MAESGYKALEGLISEVLADGLRDAAVSVCVHCGQELSDKTTSGLHQHANGLWRCQAPSVPYGHMGHPEMPCPPGDINPCLGYRERTCEHLADREEKPECKHERTHMRGWTQVCDDRCRSRRTTGRLTRPTYSTRRRRTMSTGIERIAAERTRQVEVEGWDAEHDRGHALELVKAATSYLHDVIRQYENPYQAPETRRRSRLWPWAARFWKPGTVARDLEKAGALVAAALDALSESEGVQ